MEDIKLFLGRMEDEGAIQNTLQYAWGEPFLEELDHLEHLTSDFLDTYLSL